MTPPLAVPHFMFPFLILKLFSFYFLDPFSLLLHHTMQDIHILELQNQIRKLRKQIAQVKKVIKEHSCFDGNSLDPTMFLKWVQTL